MRRLSIHHALLAAATGAALTLSSVALAYADDWLVVKQRGAILQLIDGQWQPLRRGDIVPDDRVLRTLRNSRAELVRGKETIDLGPDTQVQIFDRGGPRPFTVVRQAFGDVAIDAEARDVKHFEVQSPFVAAVVKGTHFEVFSNASGSTVSVQRGKVWVSESDGGHEVVVTVGQSASAGTNASLTVGGRVPVGPANGFGFGRNKIVGTAEAAGTSDSRDAGGSAKAASGSGNSSASNEQGKSNAGGNGQGQSGGSANGQGNSNAGGNSHGSSSSGSNGKGKSSGSGEHGKSGHDGEGDSD